MPLSGEAIRLMNYIDDVSVTLRRVLAFVPTLSDDERARGQARRSDRDGDVGHGRSLRRVARHRQPPRASAGNRVSDSPLSL